MSDAARRRCDESGFTLVAMVVLFTVMSVVVAAALPLWSKAIQREREEELIFRGLQYAEAIRVFQLRNGRLPVRLEELTRLRPRSLRQLWKDPMTEDGQWGLIFAQGPATRRGQRGGRRVGGVAPNQRARPQQFGGSAPRPLGGESARRGPGGRSTRTVAPIIGVHSLSEETGTRVFFGSERYGEWRFTVDRLPTAVVAPGTLSPLRANSRWVGRPFPPGLEPAQGTAPGGQPPRPGRQNPRQRRNRSGG